MWHAVQTSSGYEIKSAARISEAGFNAVCPVWTKKIRRPQRSGVFFRSKIEPLFVGYFFLKADEAFRKADFETEKVRLKIFRNALLTDEQMSEVRVIELKVAAEQMKAKHVLKVEVGEVLQIIDGLKQGEPVEVVRVGRGTVLVQLKALVGSHPFWINTDSVAKAV